MAKLFIDEAVFVPWSSVEIALHRNDSIAAIGIVFEVIISHD